ncbi:MAG TPA: hypothetical protein VL614_00205 [Acetobacteraceae bacterium]|jgi:hypothetical protein|nr:hypothetical protein [Acetobacteraceae bacterium]
MSDDKRDRAVEDSFPASDPPGNSGITGPRTPPPDKAPDERDDDARPKGTPNSDRHAVETAYQWEHEAHPDKKAR